MNRSLEARKAEEFDKVDKSLVSVKSVTNARKAEEESKYRVIYCGREKCRSLKKVVMSGTVPKGIVDKV
jgi:hypothetical protein